MNENQENVSNLQPHEEKKKEETQKNMYVEMKKSPICIQYEEDNWKEVINFVRPHAIRKVRRGSTKTKSELNKSGRAVIRVVSKDYPIEYGDYIIRLSYHVFIVLKEENFNEYFQVKKSI